MKLFRKKGISALLAVLLLCALLPITAHADETGVSGDVSWSFSGSTLAITGKGAMANYTDEELPPWSSYADSITRIRVESGVDAAGYAGEDRRLCLQELYFAGLCELSHFPAGDR